MGSTQCGLICVNIPTKTSTSFTARFQIMTTGTYIYSTVLQYLVYNKMDPFVSTIQLSTVWASFTSKYYPIYSLQFSF